jgi:hypothetical protein
MKSVRQKSQQQRGGWPGAATVNVETNEGASWMEQTQARGADVSHHGGQEVSLEGVEANGGPHKPGAQGLGVRGAGLSRKRCGDGSASRPRCAKRSHATPWGGC